MRIYGSAVRDRRARQQSAERVQAGSVRQGYPVPVLRKKSGSDQGPAMGRRRISAAV